MTRDVHDDRGRGRARLLAVAALGGACVTYPLLSLVDRPVRVLGLPLLWVYLFAVWVALIAVVAVLAGRAE